MTNEGGGRGQKVTFLFLMVFFSENFQYQTFCCRRCKQEIATQDEIFSMSQVLDFFFIFGLC